jgi:hypothetical protein
VAEQLLSMQKALHSILSKIKKKKSTEQLKYFIKKLGKYKNKELKEFKVGRTKIGDYSFSHNIWRHAYF